ncbi:MAG: T9SS type A sorting domain-containing protein [Acidobacteriota bacterium]
MKKIATGLLVLTLAFAFTTLGQVTKYNFKFDRAFPDTGFKNASGAHGIVVDPAGKVWIQRYGNADSIKNAAGNWVPCRVIDVFNPDGSKASFSPIKTITVGATTDTLFGANLGLDKDNVGNILAAVKGSYLYKINYRTGAGMAKRYFQIPNTITKPAADSLGEIVITSVFAGQLPLLLMDNNFTDLGNAMDTTKAFSRAVAISKDGNDVFFAGYSGKYVLRVHSDNGSLGPYTVADTLFNGKLQVESITLHPKTNYLWVSSGNNNNPSNYPGFTDFSFYAFTPPNYSTPVDSFKWNGSTANDPRPRGIAFSPTGDTVYVCQFQDPNSPVAQRFVRGVTGVTRQPDAVAKEYTLGQNYPNPFNPSTTIRFTLPVASTISLKVYDVLGKEVATLAEGAYQPGSYNVTFEAKNINSGVYFYTLKTSTGFVQSNRMLLMK